MTHHKGSGPRGERPAAMWQKSPAAFLRASSTGAAQAQAGAVANSGIVYGDVQVGLQSAPRSGYGEQVRRIVPEVLVGRETELQQLAAFCTADEGSPYAWWQAEAWAGKTALMSWFALHAPSGVRVVPFFVTARFAAQNDRIAFIEVVLEQLGELLGEGPTAFLPPSTREAHFLRLLNEAAHRCQRRGERLVLLVDGLDEDRGVTTGPDAYSIAALLPARPAPGLRVIVAGRPHPPIPADVAEDHCLHDPAIVRQLAGSPFAQVIRAEAQRELKHLLAGEGGERQLLGLLTASGGGLSASILAELTDLDSYDVEETLRSRAGRTFRARESPSRPGELSPVFVLGHEELQDIAVRMLGPKALRSYRDRIHVCAESYAAAQWPPETPEYLLHGYTRMLRATADLPRAVACATDFARHERIRKLTGGDAAALREIDDAGALVLACEDPDLVKAALLAAHRQRLLERNSYPVSLPAVWAALGQPDRAEALARGMSDPDAVGTALAEVAVAMGLREDSARAVQLADFVEGLDAGDDSACWRARRMAAVAEAAGAAGDRARAAAQERDMDRVWSSTTNKREKTRVLAARARAAAASGDCERAGELADDIEVLARTGINSWLTIDMEWAADSQEPERVTTALGHLEVLAGTVRSTRRRAGIEATLAAAAAAELGRHGPALLAAAAELERWAWPPIWILEVIGDLTQAVVASGDVPRAAGLVDLISQTAALPTHSCWEDLVSRGSLARAAVEALTACADPERAAALSRALEVVACSSSDRGTVGSAESFGSENAGDDHAEDKTGLLIAAAGAAALAGEDARAEALAAAITDPDDRAEALVVLAKVALGRGDDLRAAALATTAERVCRDSAPTNHRAQALAVMARATEAAGDRLNSARLTGALADLTRTTTSPYGRARTQVSLVGALTATGGAAQAEALTRTIPLRDMRHWAQSELVKTLSGRGEFDQAEAFVHGIDSQVEQVKTGRALAHIAITHKEFGLATRLLDAFPGTPGDQREDPARLLTVLAGAAAAGGALHRASVLADCLQDRARACSGSKSWSEMVRYAAEALAWSRRFDAAEQLARRISDPHWRAGATTALVTAAARSGETGLAAVWAHRASKSSPTNRRDQSMRLSLLVEAVTATGDLHTALYLAERIPLPSWRARILGKLAQFVDFAQGRRLMARALALGDWSNLLDDLVRLAPETLQALTNTLLGWEEPGGSSVAAERPTTTATGTAGRSDL